ncbi:NUDIX hydrolase [Psychromarinibacter sp. C21-152]|uniref:NUDIX hydrolase n=1 Tax=Psychromarinibacter sediminicola TaxID=3033385 RepID=A0AAE3NVI0_9RHOB|nr:NUDIX hydrolase [Psychromarinibacter sediminicola]MDF0602892.1 NUDIX hydrolase [Psychromarinibacter sediminicola]
MIVVRDADTAPRVLMGQRGAAAAFMPNRFVFPGGAMDPADREVPLGTDLSPACAARIDERSAPGLAPGLAAAAIRELWEETGLILGVPGAWRGAVPADWQGFAASGHLPHAAALSFVFRAVTPPGRPRRFDARFFVADAAALATDPDDLSRASDELSHLQWIRLEEVRNFHLPFVTEVVLAEVAAALPDLGPPDTVPFFDNGAEESLFRRLGGVGPMQGYGG